MPRLTDTSIDYTTTPVGGELPINMPDVGGFAGFKTKKITFANLVASLSASISAALSAANDALGKVNAINDKSIQTRNADVSASYTISQVADSDIYYFYFIWKSGAPTISVGTTLGGEDVVNAVTLSGVNTIAGIDLMTYTSTLRTLYVTVIGGTLNVIRFERRIINP
jgi:hypothetical protein